MGLHFKYQANLMALFLPAPNFSNFSASASKCRFISVMNKPLLISEIPQPRLTCDSLESSSICQLATHIRIIIFDNNLNILVINNEIANTKLDALDLPRIHAAEASFAG